MDRIHFVGIGGYSMSGLAQVFKAQGRHVTGSDLRPSSRTDRLVALGIPVHWEHRAENLGEADTVVYSTDVPEENPELAAARARGLTVLHRSELLAMLVDEGDGIAITGTHGKTTTTSMIGWMLQVAGTDPTVLVGGEVDALGGNARRGSGRLVVAEADESDGSFLRYHPRVAVITNVEPEHLEHYGGSFAAVQKAVERFACQVKPAGLVVLCAEDPFLAELARRLPARVVTYGFEHGDLRARAIEPRAGGGNRFQVVGVGPGAMGMKLLIPGRHNVLNALAALAVGRELGVRPQVMRRALLTFRNAHRRFEFYPSPPGTWVVDDYAHHPTEIRAVLAAAKELRARRIIAVFQPQRYTRTAALLAEFAAAFAGADRVLLADIYSPPGERPIAGVSSQVLAERIRAANGPEVACPGALEAIAAELVATVRPGDLVITMGAGDVFTVARALSEQLVTAALGS